jgi:hypothetical protein
MTSQLHKRLERLEALLAARVAPPIFKFLNPPEKDADAKLERLISSGEVAETDRNRVQFFRWLTHEEAVARGHETPHGHVDPVPHSWVRDGQPPSELRQLPAPPESKLLPAPAQPQTEPSPQVQAKRPLTEDQMRKLLEDRERPFGRPVRYPKGSATP